MIGTRDIDLMGDAIESVNIADCGDRSLCDLNPCRNGGVCEDISMTEYRCLCPESFTGKYDCYAGVFVLKPSLVSCWWRDRCFVYWAELQAPLFALKQAY